MRDTNGCLLVRADGGTRLGAGHVMRCIALAQAWRRKGGRVVFALAESSPSLRERIRLEGFELVVLSVNIGSDADAETTVGIARLKEADWIIADGYSFTATWQRFVHEQGCRLAMLDDYGHAEHYFADLILNQNLSADERLYVHRGPWSQLALGLPFAMLRSEFIEYCSAPRTFLPTASRVLITLGGSDPDNVTADVVAALGTMPGLESTIVVGGSNPHHAALEKLVRSGGSRMEVVRNPHNIPELMANAEIAITAGGATLWELAFMGVPALVLVLADNQRPAANLADQAGIARLVRSASEIPSALARLLADPVARRHMSDRARELVDGRGVGRVIAKLEEAA